jgi:hypothetical protein
VLDVRAAAPSSESEASVTNWRRDLLLDMQRF